MNPINPDDAPMPYIIPGQQQPAQSPPAQTVVETAQKILSDPMILDSLFLPPAVESGVRGVLSTITDQTAAHAVLGARMYEIAMSPNPVMALIDAARDIVAESSAPDAKQPDDSEKTITPSPAPAPPFSMPPTPGGWDTGDGGFGF